MRLSLGDLCPLQGCHAKISSNASRLAVAAAASPAGKSIHAARSSAIELKVAIVRACLVNPRMSGL